VVCEGGKGHALVTAGAFAPDSDVLMLGRVDGVVEVWGLEERKP
jgi:hypothetical protein